MKTEEHNKRRTRKRHKTKAITLVEIVVVLGIIALMSSLSAVFLKSQKPNLELYSAAQELRGTLLEARARSLTEQRLYQVHFTLALNQYELKEAEGDMNTLRSVTLPSMIQYYSVGPFPGEAVTFNAAGAARETGAIVIQNNEGRKKTINIYPSGYVKVE